MTFQAYIRAWVSCYVHKATRRIAQHTVMLMSDLPHRAKKDRIANLRRTIYDGRIAPLRPWG